MRSTATSALRPFRTPPVHTWRTTSLYRGRGQHQCVQSRFQQTWADDAVRIQSVRFKRAPFFTRRRFMKTVYWTAAVYVLMRVLVVPYVVVEIEHAPEDEVQGGEAKRVSGPATGIDVTDEEEEADEGDLFIPLTRAVEMPRKFYKGSDPEWQEFRRVAQDKERQTGLCEQLKQNLMQVVKKRANLRNALGKDVQSGKHWIEFGFPDGPAPDHSRKGLLIGNGKLAWGSEVVDAATYRQQSRLIWPKEAIHSAMFTGWMLMHVGYKAAMSVAGNLGVGKESAYPKEVAAIEHLAVQNSQRAKLASGPHTTDGTVTEIASSQVSPTAQHQSEETRPWPLSTFTSSTFKSSPLSDNANSSFKELWSMVKIAFAVGFIQSGSGAKVEPARGSLVMHGLVEVRGSRGRMLFDVVAHYDPKTDDFGYFGAGIRNYKTWSQRPKGGD